MVLFYAQEPRLLVFLVRFLRGVAKADGQKAASYSPASTQMAALPV